METNNRKEGAAVKRYAFITTMFTVITVTVNEDNEIVKLCHYNAKSKTIIRMTNPKILHKDGTFDDGPFEEFNLNEWMNGGEFRIVWEDLFSYQIRPTYIPVCNECGIAPVFEYVGYWSDNSGKFSQGFSKKCYSCEGLEDEPMPWVSQKIDLGTALTDAILGALDDTEDEEEDWDDEGPCTCGPGMRLGAYDPACPIDGIDVEDEWKEEINNLPENWDITNIIKEES